MDTELQEVAEFENITFKQYSELQNPEEYSYIMKYSRLFNLPNDVYNAGDFTQKTFGIVKDLQYDLTKGATWMQLLDYFSKLTGKPVKDFVNDGIMQICQFKSYVFSEIERINEIEKVGLASQPTADEEKAGIERFGIYGNYLQFVDLANDDITKIEQVKQMKYIDCFMLLKLRHDRSQFQKDLMRVRKNLEQ